jgi:hypothetical protein
MEDLFARVANLVGLAPAKADDFALLAALYVTAALFLLLAYVLAGQVWVERHSVRYVTAKGAQRMSGFWGEWFLFTACTGVVIVALTFTSVDFTELISRNARSVAFGFAVVLAIYTIYAFTVVRDAAAEGKDSAYIARLRNAYCGYAFYSVVFFACGALVVVLLGLQFVEDSKQFAAQAEVVRGTLAKAQAVSADTGRVAADRVRPSLAYLEEANGAIALATDRLQDQMNPTFLFAACIFFVNILIVATPIRYAFVSGAVAITQVSTSIAISGIFIVGLWIYFNSYAVLIEHSLRALQYVRPDPALGDWEATKRYNEIVIDLTGRRNLFGFVRAVGGEGSGLALFAAGIQFTVDRVAARDKPAEA